MGALQSGIATKSHLALTVITIVLAIDVNYVETIQCYVCNSIKDLNCDQLSANSPYARDCGEIDAEKRTRFAYADDHKRRLTPSNATYASQATYVGKYDQGLRSSQCVKIEMEIHHPNGNEEKRVVRDCTGLVCKTRIEGNGCQKSVDPQVKAAFCYCEGDKCNASDRRSHPNKLYLNLLIPIFISIINLLMN